MYAVGLQRQVLCRSGFKFNIMKSLFNKVVRVFERLASPKSAREIGKHLHLFVTITDSMQICNHGLTSQTIRMSICAAPLSLSADEMQCLESVIVRVL